VDSAVILIIIVIFLIIITPSTWLLGDELALD